MPFYGRRCRRRPRRRFSRRRYFLRHRRRYWWRRRPWGYRRSRARLVRQNKPRFVRKLKVTGVEFLGVLGSRVSFKFTPTGDATNQSDTAGGQWQIDIENVAPTNKEVTWLEKIIPKPGSILNDCQDAFPYSPSLEYWDFVGGFGQAHFTFFGLIIRAIAAFARFSDTLEKAQFIRFLGVKMVLQRAPDVNYLFLAEEHRQGLDYEKDLITPLNLLNTPGTVTVRAFKQTHCCRNPVIKRRADTSIYGWHDIEDFMKVPLISYVWTAYNPNNPVGRNDRITKFIKSPLNNKWMSDMAGKRFTDYCPGYNLRTVWDKTFVNNMNNVQLGQNKTGIEEDTSNWWDWIRTSNVNSTRVDCDYGSYSPFLPPMIAADTPQTLWFKYTFLFQLGGRSFGYRKMFWPVREADVCEPCGPPRPRYDETCDACIHPEDCDPHGLLKETAYKRIAGSPEYRKRRALAFLARLIRQRKKRKRVSWADPISTSIKRRKISGFQHSHS
ncbi:ORF1 [Grizzly bear anellovirus 4]|nr:ORF1 [Grizzly bear anellovirus 4]